jgi:hypothetical protein
VRADDLSIPPEEAIYRRVPAVPFVGMALIDEDSGEVTFKRGAFKWDKDGCSCNRHSVLVENNLTWQDVKKKPEHEVMRVHGSDLRENRMGIADDPRAPALLISRLVSWGFGGSAGRGGGRRSVRWRGRPRRCCRLRPGGAG